MRRAVLRLPIAAALLVFACLYIWLNPLAPRAAAVQSLERVIDMNERLRVDAGQEARFIFTPTANNIYTIQSFGGDAKGALYAQGSDAPLDVAEGFAIERRFVAGQNYILHVTAGDAPVDIELMRSAFGRCYERPIELKIHSAGYRKLIARPYDTHWYHFTAEEDGVYTVSTRSGIDMTGYLLSENGEELLFADDLLAPYDNNFQFQAELTAGRTYYLRVAAKGNSTGEYQLFLSRRDKGAIVPERVKLTETRLTIKDGARYTLSYSLDPLSDELPVRWISSAPAIASVDIGGEVTAHAVGEAEIIAWVAEDVYDSCRVVVEPIPVQGLTLDREALELNAGQEYQIAYEIAPANASNHTVFFTVDNADVAAVDQYGVLRALAPGTATIQARTEDGGFSAEIDLTVGEALPVYRALLLGEQLYIHRDAREARIGSVNTTQGMADMLNALSFENGGKYQVRMRMDSTRAEAIRSIRWMFRDAQKTDVSLFYINCHGDYVDGVAYLEFHDGSRLTAGQLERELRRIPGTVVVIIDCCQSGSFLSTASTAFNDAVIQSFGKNAGSSFAMSKYRVLTSTSVGQNSYRISDNGEVNESAMSTVFSRSLCEAAGWDLIKDNRISMKADLDKDRIVTLYEAYLFTRARVRGRLNKAIEKGYPAYSRQDVQIYPMGSSFPLFERVQS